MTKRDELTASETVEEEIKQTEKIEPKDTAEEAVKEAKIELSKEELKNIILEAKEEAQKEATRGFEVDKKIGDWEEESEERKQNKTARMRLFQEDGNSEFGLIIDWKFLKNERREDIDGVKVVQMYEITVAYEGDKVEKHTIPLIDFVRINDLETVEIIATEEKVLTKKHGKVRRVAKNREGYAMSPHVEGGTDFVMLGDWVDLKETKVLTIHTIKRPNGQTLKINNSRLNA